MLNATAPSHETEEFDSDVVTPARLPASSLLSGVTETKRVLGLDLPEYSLGGDYFNILRLPTQAQIQQAKDEGKRRPRAKSFGYHMSSLANVIHGIEASHSSDVYYAHARYATSTSRKLSNIKSIQTVWVDLDCYHIGEEPTWELLEKLMERAAFCGIPRPSHVVRSGRGMYLKWLLTTPVKDTDLSAWRALQLRLNQIYGDLGADFRAMDAARVLRVVGSFNSKVAPSSPIQQVGVIWDSGLRHHFGSLCAAAALIEVEASRQMVAARTKALHKAGQRVAQSDMPSFAHGDVTALLRYGAEKEPRLNLHRPAQGHSSGARFSRRTLAWSRFLDIRDLLIGRAKEAGKSGVGEGSRDLGLFWMTVHLAQSGVVNSTNLAAEVKSLLPAFDGAWMPGGRDFDPLGSGYLNTLLARVRAHEAGQKVWFAGSQWSPVYTPSNNHLIDVFGITSQEMRSMRTIIDSAEKLARADLKEPGRGERRAQRLSWSNQAMSLVADQQRVKEAGQPAVPERQLAAWISKEINKTAVQAVSTDQVRMLLTRRAQQAELKQKRAAGTAQARPYRRLHTLDEAGIAKRQKAQERAAWNKLVRQYRADGLDVGGRSRAEIEKMIAMAQDAAMERFNEQTREARAKYELDIAASQKAVSETLERIRARVNTGRAATPSSSEANECFELIRNDVVLRDNVKQDATTMMPTTNIVPSDGNPAAIMEPVRKSRRGLLNKARKAQNKAPLGESNDQVTPNTGDAAAAQHQTPASEQGQVQVPQDANLVVGPANAANPELSTASATAFIPDDLLQPWGGDIPEDAVAGDMPTCEADFSPVQDLGVELAPGATAEDPLVAPGEPAQESGLASAAIAIETAPIVNPATPRFGFRAPSDVPKESKSPPRTGFPRRVSEQRQDFARVFQDPKRGPDGVPEGYPTRETWPHDDIPAGSRYSKEEWDAARAMGANIVIEAQYDNPIRSSLLCIERKKQDSVDLAGQTRVIDGKVVKIEGASGGVDNIFCEAFDGTALVSRTSPIAQEFRGAGEGGVEVEHAGSVSWYRVIRPRAHYSDPEKMIFINAKMRLPEASQLAMKVLETASESEDETEDHADQAQAPRG